MAETVGDHVLARLREWGVEQVFGYPGDGINGLVVAFGRADDQPRFIQSRHEEMAALQAAGYAKFSGEVPASAWPPRGPARSTCSTASTTPSSTTCPWWRSSGRPSAARWAAATSRRSTCQALFKDVACDYLSRCNVPQQLPNALDRAIRTALTRRAPTAVIIPSRPADREATRRRSTRSSRCRRARPARSRSTLQPDAGEVERAAEILNAGDRVAILVGQGARGAADEVARVADVLGAGRGEGAARQGRAARRPAVRHRVDRAAGHPAQLRADARLRHAR